MSTLAAIFTMLLVWALAAAVCARGAGSPTGARWPAVPSWARARPWARARWQGRVPGGRAWLAQAAAGVSPSQFWGASGASAACGLVLAYGACGALPVAVVVAIGCGCAPFGYWASRRAHAGAERSAAWPDALRYLAGSLGAGICTVHEALEGLSVSGPPPLRAPMERAFRLGSSVGDARALEILRAELADPVADSVLLALGAAMEEGTGTALRVLSDLSEQVAADLALAERNRTLQLQSRSAVWGCLVVPYAVLFFLCATNAAYRDYFSSPAGVAVLSVGLAMSAVGLALCRRLVRPLATMRRVFVGGGAS